MATDGPRWTPDDFGLFARLLRVTDPQILRHKFPLTARARYFMEITHTGDLFLDPETGIDTGAGSPADNHVKLQELAVLLKKAKWESGGRLSARASTEDVYPRGWLPRSAR